MSKTEAVEIVVGPFLILVIKFLGALAVAMWTAYSPSLILQINKRLHISIKQAQWDMAAAAAEDVVGRWVASKEPGWEKATIDVNDPVVGRMAQDAIKQIPGVAKTLGLDNSSGGKLAAVIVSSIGKVQVQAAAASGAA
jgi:phage terminase small subunit